MKLVIENETDWPTGEFRKLFLACAKHEGMDHGGTYRVLLYYPRGGSGWGYYNRREMKIALPNWVGFPEDRERATSCCAIDRARTIIHEMGHNRGLRHKDMNGAAEQAAAVEVCDALGLNVLYRSKPKLKRSATAAGREGIARDKLAEIELKLVDLDVQHKRAVARWTKKLRKAKASVRRYDRLAAAPKQSDRDHRS